MQPYSHLDLFAIFHIVLLDCVVNEGAIFPATHFHENFELFEVSELWAIEGVGISSPQPAFNGQSALRSLGYLWMEKFPFASMDKALKWSNCCAMFTFLPPHKTSNQIEI